MWLKRAIILGLTAVGIVFIVQDWHSPVAQWSELLIGVCWGAVAWSWIRPYVMAALARVARSL